MPELPKTTQPLPRIWQKFGRNIPRMMLKLVNVASELLKNLIKNKSALPETHVKKVEDYIKIDENNVTTSKYQCLITAENDTKNNKKKP